jgi:hypothetical protein
MLGVRIWRKISRVCGTAGCDTILLALCLAITLFLLYAHSMQTWRRWAYKKYLGLDADEVPKKNTRTTSLKAPYERGLYEIVRDWLRARRKS